MYLLTICVSYRVKYLFKSLPIFNCFVCFSFIAGFIFVFWIQGFICYMNCEYFFLSLCVAHFFILKLFSLTYSSFYNFINILMHRLFSNFYYACFATATNSKVCYLVQLEIKRTGLFCFIKG